MSHHFDSYKKNDLMRPGGSTALDLGGGELFIEKTLDFSPYKLLAEDIDDFRQFVLGAHLVSQPLFDLALTKAAQTGVSLDALLLKEGLMNEEAYLQHLSKTIGVSYLSPELGDQLQLRLEDIANVHRRFEWTYFRTNDGFAIVPFSRHGFGPKKLRAQLQQFINELRSADPSVAEAKFYLVSSHTLRYQIQKRFSKDLLYAATNALQKSAPQQCAKGGMAAWQVLILVFLSGLGFYGVYEFPTPTFISISIGFSFFFFSLILFRFITALNFKAYSRSASPPTNPLARNHPILPIYTLLVPLYRETTVLPQLIKALEELDYPKAKLDIKLLLEEVDRETIHAVNAMNLPPFFHVVIVPDGQPRTKPKALNYGLLLAEGEFIGIYDAEDIPEPDQLRRALEAFETNPPECAVIQAKLNFYNPKQNWLTKQFTLEYSSLFDGLLPSFLNFSIPLPLGGTSNHFKRHALQIVGAWDPFNVTEDADLGMRFYRHGFHAGMIGSTTFEEPCSSPSSWFYQRTRWLKGWMQTYYVHMRKPFTLLRELGLWKFMGFQLVVGAPIFSALVHPLFLGVLLWSVKDETFLTSVQNWPLWGLSLFNLAVGYFATMWLGAQALRFRDQKGFFFTILTLPLYWLMISFATYRALFQLLYAPFYWEKTEHKGKDVL